ncbi:uncharacterized protein LOC108667980 isoform X2 [Hyalella azteca]|uniref:Uncharacterized protein LOC108667980 isoform X2 n=1 Tax=Hyalella azteca TaxID=294128 RepID=A0A8B7NAI7_HYAAZ|nr:uncharacterized protein LOC108667980 isoform X2 [Hyalella azteca]
MDSTVTQSPTREFVSTGSRAHQLAQMRVPHSGPSGCDGGKIVNSPAVTPVTPLAISTPSFYTLASHSCLQNECVYQDLQLAAELGKTLLEHNRSLETTVKQQQALLDDRLQEIQYLNRQTAALRVVNDTRLTVYEKLEVSMQEFEKDNARLAMQAAHDRRTIKSLQSTIESLQTAMEGLEARNLELQRSVDEARTAGLTAARGRLKRRVEDGLFRRSMSCENSNQDERSSGDEEGDDVTEQLAAQLKELRAKLDAETRKRDEVETELYALAKEHDAVLQQVAELQERQAVPATLRQELDALDEDREDDAKHRVCRKCLCNGGDVSTSPTVFDESIEDDYSMTSDRGGCLVRLANGVLAYGSQESLASMGQVMSHGNSTMTSPLTDGSEVPHNSLLSELDAQYQLLIDKYQELLKAGDERDRAEMMKAQHDAENGVYITSEAEDMSGPMSMVLPGNGTNEDVLRKCQRCSKCSCGITGTTHRPKSNLEEFSEVETSSSGFSEGESRLSNKTTQTELTHLNRMDELTPIVEVHEMDTILDLTSPINPCENRFQAAPNFKELFNEIFTVLKKNENVSDGEHLVSSPERATAEEPCESSKVCDSTGNDDEVSTTMSGSTAVGDPEADESVLQTLSGNDENSSFTTASTECLNPKDNSDETSHLTGKLARPNSLDLSNTSSSSRSSSKQRRRKRQQPKSKAELALLKQNELNSANAVRSVASTSVSPKKKANSRPEKELKSQLNEREPPPKIIGSKVDLMDLCERHRQLQNKRKNKRNRSRNSSKSRTHVKITSLDELGNIPSQSSFGGEALRQRPSSGVYTSHFQRLQHKFGEVNPESRPNKMNFSVAPSPKKAAPQPKICLPSAELAKFRKLEASYAQVLKAQIERAANRRK